MSPVLLPNPAATRSVQVWLSDASSKFEETTADGCLSPAERQLAERLTSAERRSFETGRRLGHQAVRQLIGSETTGEDDIEILSEDPTGTTSRPLVRINGETTDLKISITHLDGTVAVALTEEQPAGIDLARIQEPAAGFAEFWMSGSEQYQLDHSDDPALTAAMNWSAREAAFKATELDDEFRPGLSPLTAARMFVFTADSSCRCSSAFTE